MSDFLEEVWLRAHVGGHRPQGIIRVREWVEGSVFEGVDTTFIPRRPIPCDGVLPTCSPEARACSGGCCDVTPGTLVQSFLPRSVCCRSLRVCLRVGMLWICHG